MSYTSNPINSQSLNGIISLSDGVLNIEDGVISNIQLLKVVGNTELDGNLVVDGKISCAYTALLGSDVVNKAFVDDAFNTNSRFLKVDGTNQMNADLNMNTNKLNNVSYVSNPTQLNFQIGTQLPLIIQSNQSSIAVPLIFNLASGGVGINLNGSNITYCGSIHGYNNTNLILSYYNGVVVSPKISLTSGKTLITDGLKISNIGIDMSGNSINLLGNGVADGDGINKKQMDDADNLRLKLDGLSAMTGDLNMNNHSIFNVSALNSPSGYNLNLQLANANVLQLSTTSSTFSKFITFNFTTGTGINMNSNSITNLSNGVADGDGINKKQMNDADNLRLKLDGTTPMTAVLNMNSFGINNVPILQAGASISLKILTATIMQIQALKVLMSMPIDMGGKLINGMGNGVLSTDAATKGQMDTSDNLKMDKLNGSGTGMMTLTNPLTQLKLVASGGSSNLVLQNTISTNGCLIDFWDSGSIPVASIQTGHVSRTLNILTESSTAMTIGTTLINCLKPTQITGGLKINTGGIDMNSTLITSLGNGVFATDGVNKGQLDVVNNLKMNSLNGAGTGLMTLTNSAVSLKLTNSVGSGNLVLESLSNAQISFQNITTHNPVATISASTTSDNLYFYNSSSYTPSLMLNSTSVNCLLPTNITGGLTMTTGGSSPIDMSGNNIANALITTPTIVAPIQTSTSSIYDYINNNYLNIGYTKVVSYNIPTPMLPSTSYRLLAMIGGLYNKLTIYAGVWIITATFNPFCSANTPDTQGIQMLVSNVNSFTNWAAYPASNWRQMCNGAYNTIDYTNIVNTFVVTLTAQTDLYLWGVVDYSGTATSWTYNLASLRATRIA